ncbi:MAG: GldG family protein [Caldiserica bacterium]|nr:GldG family protein [Caldisericota bacterium]
MEKKSKRVIKYGLHSLISVVAVVGIVMVSYALLGRYHKRWDLTQNKRFTLSLQTIKVLKNLQKPLEITAFWKMGSPQAAQVEELLKQYSYRSPYIRFRMVDPDKNPTLAQQKGVSEYGTTVFEYEGRKKVVYERDVFTYSFMGMGSQEFKGEEAFTTAIMELTSGKKEKIYFITGHGEKDLYDSGRGGYSKIMGYLGKEGYEVETWNILEKGKLPEDASLLVMAGPRVDILDKEKQLLQEYMNKKQGKFLLLVDPGVGKNVKELAKSLGVKVEEGMVIDPVSSYFGEAAAPIPQYNPHKITNDLIKSNSASILAGAVGLEKVGKGDVILESRNTSWLEKDYRTSRIKFNKGIDKKGPIPVGIAIEEGNKRIVVFGDSDFASNSLAVVQGNIDLFMNTIGWLTKEENKISIRPKKPEMRPFKLSAKEARFVVITSLFLIPLLILGTGIFIWWKRRSL